MIQRIGVGHRRDYVDGTAVDEPLGSFLRAWSLALDLQESAACIGIAPAADLVAVPLLAVVLVVRRLTGSAPAEIESRLRDIENTNEYFADRGVEVVDPISHALSIWRKHVDPNR